MTYHGVLAPAADVRHLIVPGAREEPRAGEPFTATSVQWVRYAAHLDSLRQRLRAKGMLTSTEIARQLGTDRKTVMQRLCRGELRARQTNDNGRWVFWPLAWLGSIPLRAFDASAAGTGKTLVALPCKGYRARPRAPRAPARRRRRPWPGASRRGGRSGTLRLGACCA